MTDAMEAHTNPAPFAVDVVATLDDQVACSMAMAARPETARLRRIWMVGVILLVPLIGFVGGVLAAGVQDSTDPSLVEVLDNLSAMDWWNAAALVLAASGSIASILLVLQVLRRPILRWQVRRLLLQRPWIDPQNPDLGEHVRAIFDADGYTAEGKGNTMTVTWPFVTGIEDRDGLLILRVGRKGGFVLPKRDLSAEQIDAIRAFVDAHAGISSGRSGQPFVSPWQ